MSFPVTTFAAGIELYFRTTASTFAPGSEFTVGVFVNAPVSVNAFDVEVGYSVQSLELLGVSTADSIVGLWKDSPEILSAGIVRFRGAALPSFRGTAGELLKLNFRVRPASEAGGTLQWSFRKTAVFLSDGRGTLAESAGTPLVLPVSSDAPLLRIATSTDIVPPVFLSVRAARNPIDGSYLAVWAARDDDSGVRDAALRVRRWLFPGPWMTAENPVKLPRGAWAFELKISDNAGNHDSRTVYLWPVAAEQGAYVLAALLVAFTVGAFLRRRRARDSSAPR